MNKYPQIYPDLKEWPIYQYAKQRAEFVNALRTQARIKVLLKHENSLAELIQKAAYMEKMRLKNNPWKVDPASEAVFWKKVESEILEALKMDSETRQYLSLQILDRIIHRYAEEIVSDFKISTYKLARKVLTKFFKGLYNSISDYRFFLLDSPSSRIENRVRFSGEFDRVYKMFNKGIVVFLPTHFSHLDSILVGYISDRKGGLPAFLYGAGLNLYDSEIFAYFMNRLGTYRVDRRKKNAIYQETLKCTSNLAIQWGVNSLFFPGGTRSRSGKIEEKLKYGLLHSLVEAQREMYEQGRDTKIIVVPIVTNYHFVFEAGQLIRQHLRRSGAERSIGKKSGMSSLRNIIRFLGRIMRKRSEASLSFGTPIDVMGNVLNDDMESLDDKGNIVNLAEYYYSNNVITYDDQRERVYTRQLAERITGIYHQYMEVMTSHLVSHAAFSFLLKSYPSYDIFDIIKLDKKVLQFDESVLLEVIRSYVDQIKQLHNRGDILMAPELEFPVSELFNNGLYHLGIYHMDRPLRRNRRGEIVSDDLRKLYYYYNRLEFLELNEEINWADLLNR